MAGGPGAGGGYFQRLRRRVLAAPAGMVGNARETAQRLAAVAGHIFSPFVGFRGGKGVATAAGVFLAICPLAVLYCLAVWGAVFALFRIVSVASLAAALCLPLFVRLTVDPALPGFAVISSFSYGIALAVILTHRSNIGRLFRGQEKRLSRGGGEPK